MDCVFLGYAFHSIGYRFFVVKSEVLDMHVGTIMESNDATFFEDIFPMKDMLEICPRAIIKWLLLYFVVHDNCLLFML